jgi:hypothetical protein
LGYLVSVQTAVFLRRRTASPPFKITKVSCWLIADDQ